MSSYQPRAVFLTAGKRHDHGLVDATAHISVLGVLLSGEQQAAGHDAKPHYDAHYDVILPPLAVHAGLGELGRNNILVADRFGSRVS